MQSSDDIADQSTETISKIVHGLNMYDVQRALVAVISCGICTSSKSRKEVDEMLITIFTLLYEQVYRDRPKIKAMQANNEYNEFISSYLGAGCIRREAT